jgi:hypothetical protein
MDDTIEETTNLRVRFRPTYDDVAGFSREVLGRNPRARLVVVIMSAWYALPLWALASRAPLWVTLSLLAVPASWIVLGRMYLRYKFSRAFHNDARYRLEYIYDFSAQGVESRVGEETRFWPWTELPQISESPRGFLITRSDGCTCILPRAAIVSDEDDETLRALIRRYAPDHGSGLARELNAHAPAI